MNLVDIAVVFLGGYVVVIIIVAGIMTLWSGAGPGGIQAEPVADNALPLKQRAGTMPMKPWGFRPPVKHSQYDPAPWQVKPPSSDESSIENVDRATEIKRELGSEHPPWERLDRRGL